MFFANLEPISKLPVLHDKCKTSFYEEQKFVKEPKKFCVYLHIMQYLYSGLEDKKKCVIYGSCLTQREKCGALDIY